MIGSANGPSRIGFNGASGIKRWGPLAAQSLGVPSDDRFNGASGIKRWGLNLWRVWLIIGSVASMGPAVLSAGDRSDRAWNRLRPNGFNGASGIKRWGLAVISSTSPSSGELQWGQRY